MATLEKVPREEGEGERVSSNMSPTTQIYSLGAGIVRDLHARTHAHTHTHTNPPLGHVAGVLEEAGVVVLLEAVLRLGDECAGALQTLTAVGDLLGQLTELHHLDRQTTRR
jgi:hypothetical protein